MSLTLSLKRVKLGFEEERTMLKFFIRTGVISGIILGLSVPVGFANSKSGGSKSSYNKSSGSSKNSYNSKSSSSSKNSYNSKSSSSKSSKNFGGSKYSPPSHHHASFNDHKPRFPHKSHKPPKPPKPPKDRSPHDCRNPTPGEQGGRSPCAPHPFGATLFRLFSHH